MRRTSTIERKCPICEWTAQQLPGETFFAFNERVYADHLSQDLPRHPSMSRWLRHPPTFEDMSVYMQALAVTLGTGYPPEVVAALPDDWAD